MLAFLAALLVVCALPVSAQEDELPFWAALSSDTVTISRSEYESLQRFNKLELLIELTQEYYYEDVDVDAMLEEALVGLMYGVGDVYTNYYTAEDWDAFNEETTGQYAGLGMQLLSNQVDSTITITRVFKGSPAEKAGLRAGDKLIAVNDVYYSASEVDVAVSIMRGQPGESVKVTVLRGFDQLDFECVREEININYVEYDILEEQNLGYVMVYDFLGDAYEGFTEAIESFKTAGVDGMIIDLRNNGGGLLDAAVQMADLLVPQGTVVTIRDKEGNATEYHTEDNDYYDIPMVVLVNDYTASASEILAGAIQDYGVGVLMGVQTFGKGIVQNVFDLGDGTGVKITVAQYFTPNGSYIHGVGLTPDVEIALSEDVVTTYGINNIPREQDNQLQRAIEFLVQGETLPEKTQTAEAVNAQGE